MFADVGIFKNGGFSTNEDIVFNDDITVFGERLLVEIEVGMSDAVVVIGDKDVGGHNDVVADLDIVIGGDKRIATDVDEVAQFKTGFVFRLNFFVTKLSGDSESAEVADVAVVAYGNVLGIAGVKNWLDSGILSKVLKLIFDKKGVKTSEKRDDGVHSFLTAKKPNEYLGR